MPARKPPASGKEECWAAATGKGCRPSDFLPYPLMHLARYQQDAHGTGGGGDEYRQPTVGNQIQIADDGDAWRHEEKRQVCHQRVGKLLQPLGFHPPRLKHGKQNAHADDAAGQFDARKVGGGFAEREAAEQDEQGADGVHGSGFLYGLPLCRRAVYESLLIIES